VQSKGAVIDRLCAQKAVLVGWESVTVKQEEPAAASCPPVPQLLRFARVELGVEPYSWAARH